MARKGQIAVQDSLETNEEFDNYLIENHAKLILLEVYSEFCGQCIAMLSAVRKIKLDIAGEEMAFAKAPADNIDALARFRGKSEPIYLFISKGKTTKIFFGSNGVKLCDDAVRELGIERAEKEGTFKGRVRVDMIEMLPEEQERVEMEEAIAQEILKEEDRQEEAIQASRKKRVCERLASNPDVKCLNFIMFWPHCHQAHYDLYEKWDRINLNVGAKEMLVLTEEQAREVFYMSDVDANEACMHALLSGEVMAVLLKKSDSDNRDFIRLMRYSLYEEIPELKEDVPEAEQPPQVTPFVRYGTISKTKPQIRRMRYEEKLEKKRQEEEEKERLQQEQERLAREAEEERVRMEKQKEDEARIARLQAGVKEEAPPEEEGEELEGEQLDEVEEQVEPPAPEEAVPEEIEEEVHPEEEAEFNSQTSIEGEEYIPPGGLFVPGLYAPPNELAKANGLTTFFPRFLSQLTVIESEFLPPHLLLTFPVDKRHEVMEVAAQFEGEIVYQGIFAGDDPYTAEHVAYTVKQYDKMFRIPKADERLALMVSHKRSVPALTLTALGPSHISMDRRAAVRECQALFPVGYGDDYFEEESVHELEAEEEEEAPVIEDVFEEPQAPEQVEEEELEDED